MLTIVVSLAVCVLIVASVGVLMFLEVAFSESRTRSLGSASKTLWRPPLFLGRRLFEWASAAAERVTATYLREPCAAKAVAGLIDEIHEGTTAAIDPSRYAVGPSNRIACPAYCHSPVAVSPPEAIRLADYIHKELGSEEAEIRGRAEQNLRDTAVLDRFQYDNSATRCPLIGDDNVCLTYAVRPLRCRGWCPKCEQPPGSAPTRNARDYESRAQLLTEGVEHGLTTALHARGLDGDLYELNDALLVALNTPHAAERWMRGEQLFENCARCE